MSAAAQALAAEITTALGETAPDPVGQIARAVDRLGVERVRAFLTQVQDIEAGVAGCCLIAAGAGHRGACSSSWCARART